MIRLNQYAKLVNIHYQTSYRQWNKGLLEGTTLPTGSILVKSPIKIPENKNIEDIKVALYARVSSSENKDNLERQLERIREYSIAKGYLITEEVKEIGSGINANRRKLLRLLKKDTYNLLNIKIDFRGLESK